MTSAATVIALAKGEVGYKEQPTNRTKYGTWFGLDGQPWCAMFQSYIFWSGGLPLGGQTRKGFASCELGLQWFKGMGLYKRTGTGRFYPGDLAFFQFDKDAAADHIGLIIETKANSIVCVEGNTSKSSSGSQSDGGGVYIRERSLGLVLGVGRPLFSDDTPMPTPPPQSPPVWPGRHLTLTSPYTRGFDVVALQQRMASWGSKIVADGVFGRGTYDAVRWWQAVFALEVDGIVGRDTWSAFFSR